MEKKGIEITDYKPGHQYWFEELNRQWIEKYFRLEPIDRFVLSDPESAILGKGGAILMASIDNRVVGTVGLKKVDEQTFEFTKMAVAEDSRGLGIGEALGRAAIEKAKTLGANRIILYSHSSLRPAIGLYRKLGFSEIPLEPGTYDRCDIKMERRLTAVRVVQARESFAPVIAEIGKNSFADAFGSFFNRPEDLSQYLSQTYDVRKLEGSMSKANNLFLVCLSDDFPAGFAKIKKQSPNQKIRAERQTELQKIYVLNEFHGKGIAQALFHRVLDLVLEIRPEYLWLDVLKQNARAIRFYEKNGFSRKDIHSFTIGTQRFEYDVMVRPITPLPETSEKKLITTYYGNT